MVGISAVPCTILATKVVVCPDNVVTGGVVVARTVLVADSEVVGGIVLVFGMVVVDT